MLEEISYSYENSLKEIKNIKDLFQLASAEKNEVIAECINKIEEILKKIKKVKLVVFIWRKRWFEYLSKIHAGAGGTESQDWAEMLRRMYMKWFDKKKFSYNIISEHQGEEAGIKSSTIKVDGEYAYGLMKSESGVHRLVRISPFDSGARRHTSFASVWVYPAVEDDINIKIEDKDLRVDTYRSREQRPICKYNW